MDIEKRENNSHSFFVSKDSLFSFAIITFSVSNLRLENEPQPLNIQAKANTCTCNYSSSLSNGFATF
jgi:hypothetical protein